MGNTSIEPVKVVANILQVQMGLTTNQIFLDFQNFILPKNGMFIVLDYIGPSEMYANQNYFNPVTNSEVQEVVAKHTIQIDIMSIMPDTSARERRFEVALSLKSFYSQQQQDINNIGIAWLQSDFINNTDLEGSAMMQRYTTTCAVYSLFQKIIPSQYYDKFGISLTTETQGGRGSTVSINPAVDPQ